MKPVIVLDSTPLALIVQRRDVRIADRCRAWVAANISAGRRLIVPEIVHYELRRELLRLKRSRALADLEVFCAAAPDRVIPLHSRALRLAAGFWATTRQQGRPTADPHALDIDVILAAQVLSHGLRPADFVVATSNVAHLAQFVPAELWSNI